MSRSRFMKGAALLALSAPLLGSCVADSVSLRITCSIVPDDDCTYTTSGKCYLDGGLNLGSVNDRYQTVLLVTNGLKGRARDVPPQAEPNGVSLTEFEVEVTDSAGRKPKFARALPNPFTVKASGVTIEPGDDALVGAELLPRAYVIALRDLYATQRPGSAGTVYLSVIARGRTWGDVPVESAPWPWTVQLLSLSEQAEVGQCFVYEDTVCTLGQDGWRQACFPVATDDT